MWCFEIAGLRYRASQQNLVPWSLASIGTFPDLNVSKYLFRSMTPHPGDSLHSRIIPMDSLQYPVSWPLASLGAFPDLLVSMYFLSSMTSHPAFSLGSTIITMDSSKYPVSRSLASLDAFPDLLLPILTSLEELASRCLAWLNDYHDGLLEIIMNN